MAGDWLRCNFGLRKHRCVLMIAGTTGLDPDTIVGKLMHLWEWAQTQTSTGKVVPCTPMVVDDVAGRPGFAQAMADADWLEIGQGWVKFTRWEKNNSKGAKARSIEAQRKASYRERTSSSATAREREHIPKNTREFIFKRDKHRCAYCSKGRRDAELSLDHVIPITQGGLDDHTNLVTCCKPCNSQKNNRTPDQAGMALRPSVVRSLSQKSWDKSGTVPALEQSRAEQSGASAPLERRAEQSPRSNSPDEVPRPAVHKALVEAGLTRFQATSTIAMADRKQLPDEVLIHAAAECAEQRAKAKEIKNPQNYVEVIVGLRDAVPRKLADRRAAVAEQAQAARQGAPS